MSDANPNQTVTDWLAGFEKALSAGDIDAAVGMFDDDSYWRDLVSFTWNIKTMEGKEQIADMLKAQLAGTKPSNWTLDGDASHADGISEGWILFETGVARGKGHIRLKGDKCWTLLTTMVELKGHEEKKGPTREQGVEHGAYRDRKTWLEERNDEAAELGYSRQPYCVIVGGGQGRTPVIGQVLRELDGKQVKIEKKRRWFGS